MDNNDFGKHIEQVCDLFEDRKTLFLEKNQNYGCSYIKAGEIMQYILDGKQPKLVTAEDHMAYQIIIRKLDKIIRFITLRFTEEHDKVGEKTFDTMSDDGVYSFMLAQLEKPDSIKIKKKVLLTEDK